jgi:NTP pyrophosphatase (non-canonical NTP hydrolase)
MSGLTFRNLRAANMLRLPQFKNALGNPAHAKADGSDWTAAQWLQAVVGELGEYANIRKKFERGDIDREAFLQAAADELADTVTYIDLLAVQLGISLDKAIRSKFNRVSLRAKSLVVLTSDGVSMAKDEADLQGYVRDSL